jgi:hypothetical protein
MSTDDSDSDEQNPAYLGTRMGSMTTNAMMAASGHGNVRQNSLPRMFTRNPGSMSDGRRALGMFSENEQPTIWDAVNYPREGEFRFDSFYLRYERQPEARAIIDKPVNDTWQDAPIVKDEKYKDEDSAKSKFEKQVEQFWAGEYTRRKPVHRLNVGDKLGRLGEYSLIVLGTADGRDLDTPLNKNEFTGLDDLNYIATFGQDRVVNMDVETDMTSPRFRLPKFFNVITQEGEEEEAPSERDSQRIHWSRVIHVPEGSLEDDLRGTPALKPVFHELLNIDKIKAASAEGYWRGGYMGLLIRPPTDDDGKPYKFEDDGTEVQNEIRDFLDNFQRTIATPATVESIDVDIQSPGPHLSANYESIAAALDLPKSILTGEDRADTATSEDVRQWHQKVGQRRNTFANPVIVEPLIQRMIDYGLLPEPEGEGFVIEWPGLDELTEQQTADLRNTRSNTIKNISPGGDPSMIATVPELRSILGWGKEMGSEVEDEQNTVGEAAPVDEDDLNVDEEELPEPLDAEEYVDEQVDEDTPAPEATPSEV